MERLPDHGALDRFCSAKAARHKSYVLCDPIYTEHPRQAHSQKHRADPEREPLLTHKGAPCRLTEMSRGASLAAQMVESACNAGDPPGSGRSPGEGNGYPLQYSCLETPRDGADWQTTYCLSVSPKSQTRLSNFTYYRKCYRIRQW